MLREAKRGGRVTSWSKHIDGQAVFRLQLRAGVWGQVVAVTPDSLAAFREETCANPKASCFRQQQTHLPKGPAAAQPTVSLIVDDPSCISCEHVPWGLEGDWAWGSDGGAGDGGAVMVGRGYRRDRR